MEHDLSSDFGDLPLIKSQQTGLANILYAEDNVALRYLFTLCLTRVGYAVTSVENGEQAWEALQATKYDLLITDIEMPVVSGLELVQRAMLTGLKLPIIIASGLAEAMEGSEYEWLKGTVRLQKPFGAEELIQTVRRMLGTSYITSRDNSTQSTTPRDQFRPGETKQ